MSAEPSPAAPPNGNPQPARQQNQESVWIFADAWSVYEHVLARNHMFHDEIYASVPALLQESFAHRPFSVLDLGCGSAQHLARALAGRTVSRYLGYANLSTPRFGVRSVSGGAMTCSRPPCISLGAPGTAVLLSLLNNQPSQYTTLNLKTLGPHQTVKLGNRVASRSPYGYYLRLLGPLPLPFNGQSYLTPLYLAKCGPPSPGKPIFLETRQQPDWQDLPRQTRALAPAKPQRQRNTPEIHRKYTGNTPEIHRKYAGNTPEIDR